MKRLLLSLLFVATSFATVTSTNWSAGPTTGDGSDTTFTFSFGIFNTSDLVVEKWTIATGAKTTLTETTDYTVSATNNNYWAGPGGTVTVTTAPESTEQIFIYRKPGLTQTNNLSAYSSMRNVSTIGVENTLDAIVTQNQYLYGLLDMLLADSSGTFSIPTKASRATSYPYWDSDGKLTSASAIDSSQLTVTSGWETALADTIPGWIATPMYHATSRYGSTSTGLDDANDAADNGGWILVDSAVVMDANVTLANPVLVAPSGTITLGNYDITFEDTFEAGDYTVFTYGGTGVVTTNNTQIKPEWWGAAVGDSTSDHTAFTRAIASIADMTSIDASTSTGSGAEIVCNRGIYNFDAQLIINRNLTLSGAATDRGGFPNTTFQFDADVNGILVTRTGAGTAGDPYKSGSGAWIRGLRLLGSGTAEACGLAHTRQVNVWHCFIQSFGGHGVYCGTSISAGMPSWAEQAGSERFVETGTPVGQWYASGSRFESVYCVSNGLSGFYNIGGDTNGNLYTNCVSNSNGDWGFVDGSAIGGTYINCLPEVNGKGPIAVPLDICGSVWVGCNFGEGNGVVDATQDTVLGSDGYYYTCSQVHVSAAATEPNVGARWEQYWAQSGSAGDAWDSNSVTYYGQNGVSYLGTSTTLFGCTDISDSAMNAAATAEADAMIHSAVGGFMNAPRSRVKNYSGNNGVYLDTGYPANAAWSSQAYGMDEQADADSSLSFLYDGTTKYWAFKSVSSYELLRLNCNDHATYANKLVAPTGLLLGTGDGFVSTVTAIKTIDVNYTDTTGTDYQFDNRAAQTNTTEQVITVTNMIPAYAEVISCQLRCIETVSDGSPPTTMDIDVGTSSGGNEILANAQTDSANDINTTAAAAGPELGATNAARSVYVNATPGDNWSTLTDGKWAIMVTYINYGQIYTDY